MIGLQTQLQGAIYLWRFWRVQYSHIEADLFLFCFQYKQILSQILVTWYSLLDSSKRGWRQICRVQIVGGALGKRVSGDVPASLSHRGKVLLTMFNSTARSLLASSLRAKPDARNPFNCLPSRTIITVKNIKVFLISLRLRRDLKYLSIK